MIYQKNEMAGDRGLCTALYIGSNHFVESILIIERVDRSLYDDSSPYRAQQVLAMSHECRYER